MIEKTTSDTKTAPKTEPRKTLRLKRFEHPNSLWTPVTREDFQTLHDIAADPRLHPHGDTGAERVVRVIHYCADHGITLIFEPDT